MMKKVYEAKILRSKIDESEVNRLKGEIVHLERQNAEADAQRAVLDHAKDDLMQQKKSLEAKVAELNQTLQDEISARLQVVDALANALKTAETKESDLHSKIHQLQEAINKSSWQAKVEAKELSLALKKRTEVRMHFFLQDTPLIDFDRKRKSFKNA
jgi:chromosome segregation ATPase